MITRPRNVHRHNLIPYTPDTWSDEQRALHECDDLDIAFRQASSLCGGWYRRAVTIDSQVTETNSERYMIRPADIAQLDGWEPIYTVARAAR